MSDEKGLRQGINQQRGRHLLRLKEHVQISIGEELRAQIGRIGEIGVEKEGHTEQAPSRFPERSRIECRLCPFVAPENPE